MGEAAVVFNEEPKKVTVVPFLLAGTAQGGCVIRKAIDLTTDKVANLLAGDSASSDCNAAASWRICQTM